MIKVLLFFLGAAGLIFAVFAAGAWFFFSSAPDLSHLRTRVDAKAVEAVEASRGSDGEVYEVIYSYKFDGVTFYGEDWWKNQYWNPGMSIWVCVDPTEPAKHTPIISVGDRCGGKELVGSVHTGTKSPPSK